MGYLYDYENSAFSEGTLDALATATGKYSSFNELLDDASSDDFQPIKGSTFGTNTLFFGKNCYTGADLEWTPVYISQAEIDGQNQLILTLWLSYTARSGLYEIATFNNQYNSHRKTNPSSNMYSSSYVHALINNGYSNTGTDFEGVYFDGYGNVESDYSNIIKAMTYEHIATNKFAEFTGEGIFADRIVAPKNVSWQMALKANKNDPANTDYASQNGAKYKYNGWTADNLWLPSVAEVNTTWGITNAQRANVVDTRLRSGDPGRYSYSLKLTTSGYTDNNMIDLVSGSTAVRPALHLKLSSFDVTAKEPNDVEKEYKGTPYARTDIVGSWYKPEKMDVEWPVDMVNVGKKEIKVTLNDQAKQDGIKFNGTPDKEKGEDDYTRYFTFEITKKKVTIGWSKQNYESESSYFMLPSLDVTSDVLSLLKDSGNVKYYLQADYDTANGSAIGPAVGLLHIEEGKNYYAVVEIDGDKTGGNYEFGGSLYCAFNTTDGRKIVYVSITNTDLTYNGGMQLPAIPKVVDKSGSDLTGSIDIDITYKDSDGNTLPAAPNKAGAYTVVVKIKPADSATYKIGDTKEFEYIIKKAEPVLKYERANEDKLYVGRDLPEIVSDTVNGGTNGIYTPDVGQKMLSGKGNKYTYTFTPEDKENYNIGTVQVVLDTETANLDKITAEFKLPQDEDPGESGGEAEPVTVYTSWTESDIKKYLTVYTHYDNGDKTKVNISSRYSIVGGLPLRAGGNTLVIKYASGGVEKECEIQIDDVVKSELEKISSVVISGTVYSSYDMDYLKGMLKVSGKYNDGKTDHAALSGFTVSVDPNNLDENGKLKAGKGIKVTVTYVDSDNSGKVHIYDNLIIDVTAVKLENIIIEFDAGPYTITGSTDKVTLMRCMTVTGGYNDGSSVVLDIEEKDIATKLVDSTTLRITVTRDGISGYYDVKVPEEENVKVFTLSIPKLDWTYTGEEIDILKDWEFANLVENGAVEVTGNKKTNAGIWELTITIKQTDKYKWFESITHAKFALAKEDVGYEINGYTLTANWKIAQAVVKANWNDRGTLDIVCSGYKGDINEIVKYTYYKDGVKVDISVEPLVTGTTYTVTAELVDTDNFIFDEATKELVLEPHEFTKSKLPSNGFTAVWGKITNVMTKKMAGLPLWAWLAIAVALLILLIIIIAVACKRRKSKEEREAKKAVKEEERQRREEERKLQQERLEAERELARAKQEAELEKIRAQAGMAAGMGMATMSIQQPQAVQPQAQPVQQQVPVQQAQQVQQPIPMASAPASDMYALEARLRIAEERARYAEERIARDAEERARQAEERTLRAAEERARFAEEQLMRNAYMNRVTPVTGNDNGNISLDALGALVLAALKNYAGGEKPEQIAPAEQPQLIEAGSSQTANIPAVYPPDAVVTTTTTVDTTKKNFDGKAVVRNDRNDRKGDSGILDIDGFYDPLD